MKRIAIVFALVFALSGIASAQEIPVTLLPPMTNTPQAIEDAVTVPVEIVTDAPVEIVGYVEPQPGLLDPANDKFEAVVLGIVVVVCLVMALLSALVAAALVMIYKSAPPAVRSAVDYNLPYITDKLDRLSDNVVALASKTPNTFDDAAAKWFNDNFDRVVRETVVALRSTSEAAHQEALADAEG